MVFVKTPMYQKNTYTVPMVLKKTPHNGDIFTMDHMDALSATGGVDNKVCIWNSISGTVRSIMSMPRRDNRPNIFISQIKFMKSTLLGDGGYLVVLLLVIQNNGDLYCINPVSEQMSARIATLHSNPKIDFNPND
jgi:hypothetical protein